MNSVFELILTAQVETPYRGIWPLPAAYSRWTTGAIFDSGFEPSGRVAAAKEEACALSAVPMQTMCLLNREFEVAAWS